MAGSHSEPSSPKTEEERRAARAKARADALARAAEAEKLADATAKERDAVAERLREALLLAAKERAAADAADPSPPRRRTRTTTSLSTFVLWLSMVRPNFLSSVFMYLHVKETNSIDL